MKRLDDTASGTFNISATPFDDAGRLDLENVPQLVEFYLGHGVSGLTILGMMGEATKLTSKEQCQFSKAVMEQVDGRVPVIVGLGDPGFVQMRALSDYVMEIGAAGVMVAPPSTLRGDQAVKTFISTMVASIGTDVPFVLQDFPLSTGVVLSASLIQEIAEQHPSMAMLKHEDWPGLDKITNLRKMHDQGARRYPILTGNGGVFLPFELARGADGAMTGFAYPELLVRICELVKAGKRDAALDIFDVYLPLIRYEQQPGMGLVARKYILQKRGALRTSKARAPSPPLTSETQAELDLLMDRLDSRLAAS